MVSQNKVFQFLCENGIENSSLEKLNKRIFNIRM